MLNAFSSARARSMAYGFLDIAMTPSVKAAQVANGSAGMYQNFRGHREFDRFAAADKEFIAARNSFYLATVSETGWPYVQHRGGPTGFLKVLDDRTLACADFRGNRQYISLGNFSAQDKACLFLMDYPHRTRLKIYVHAEVRSLEQSPDLMEQLALPGYKAKVERALVFHLETFDWNCPQHITPRFTEEELSQALAPVKERIAALEEENRRLKERLAVGESHADVR
jgi:predicted pyridoxine 5'-phosphate oxidase superfamily flavin-nucleotide-binding protein